jgi:hypothetical protein
MPSNCTIEIEANGESLMGNGMPAWLVVYGRIVAGQCNRVRCQVSAIQGGVVLFSDDVIVDQNGVWRCEFPLITVSFSCGATIWVEAQCLDGGECATAESVTIHCKQAPGGGTGSQPNPGGNNGTDNGSGNGNGNVDWPWPWWPPAVFCPLIGRFFTSILLLAWTAYLVAVANQNTTYGGIALGAIAADFAVLGLWMQFCRPHFCHVIGAILWVAKRVTVAGFGMLLIVHHLPMIVALWTTGAISGILAGMLLKRRCSMPRLGTPLNQLPIW